MTQEEFKTQIEYPLNQFATNEDVHFGKVFTLKRLLDEH